MIFPKNTNCSTHGLPSDFLRTCCGLASRGTIAISVLFLTIVLASCTKPTQHSADNEYAQGFAIEEEADGVRLTIFDTQDHSKVVNDIIIPNGKPFTHIATSSATHVGFLQALGATDCITGVCDPQYVYNSVSGAADLGSSLELNPERIYASGSEVLVLSYTTNEKNIQLLEGLGVACIYCNEWTEQHPLARAEWIRVFGALTGHLHEADSIFASVREAYLEERSKQTAADSSVSIMSGSSWQGTWYVPSGNTYMGCLFKDAGFGYAYANDSTGESLPLSFEQALLAFKDADIWVGAPGKSLSELIAYDEKHAWFKAYEMGRVYNFDRRVREGSTANDFWETGVVHPELILHDLLLIRNNANDSLLYFSKLLK